MTRTALVTGATDGIGYETARQLAALKWRVLVHGRNTEKAAAAAEHIARSERDALVEPVAADLSRMTEVVSLAASVRKLAPALDVLINNAGVYVSKRYITQDRLEQTMAVNHFAPFLLTRHLLTTMQRAPEGRIVTVSSAAHSSGRIDVNDLTFAAGYAGYRAYGASKLANVLFTAALARRLTGTSVTANAVHPGVIATKLLRAGWGAGGAPATNGARTSVYLATSTDVAGVSGKYFVDCRAVAPSRDARDEALAEALWQTTEKGLTGFL
jgi:NAD(P)-dependent dehydrogenase (short-subunit alcohol dehydrogenase family)